MNYPEDLGLNLSDHKLIVIIHSHCKTGTKSFGEALRILGYKNPNRSPSSPETRVIMDKCNALAMRYHRLRDVPDNEQIYPKTLSFTPRPPGIRLKRPSK